MSVVDIELTGFTLFRTSKGWQLSVREKHEEGWLIKVNYPDEDAQKLLKLLCDNFPENILIPPKSEQPQAPKPPTGRLELRPLRQRVYL